MAITIPRVPKCCFVVPLHTGAFLIAGWMFIWNLYSGVTLITLPDGFSIILKLLAVPYLCVALISFQGAKAIHERNAQRTMLFSKAYLASILLYTLVQIAVVVVSMLQYQAISKSATDVCVSAQNKANAAQGQTGAATINLNCNSIPSVSFPIVSWLLTYLVGVLVQGYLFVCIRSYALELLESAEKSGEGTEYKVQA